MFLHKKILILIILVIFSYILFHLLKKRRQIFITNTEGLTLITSPASEVAKMTSIIPTGIMSVLPNNSKLKLREYCVKSSYNSALSGQYISVQAIKYVLSRGCRLLDFEVFLIDNAPCVAYSIDPTFVTITSHNSITLNNALQTVITNAFSAPSPNSSDPIFVQLRIKSTNPLIYNMVGMAIQNYLADRLYIGKVDGTTIFSDLLGKIVLIIDKSVAPDYAKISNYPNCDNTVNDNKPGCYNISNFMNMESGTGVLRMYTYANLLNQAITPPIILDTEKSDTDISLLRIVQPDYTTPEANNPNSNEFIQNYGVQFVTFRFYISDSPLTNYEAFFSANKSAFVPYSNAISYFK
jgi:hypothetical protein